MESHIPNLIKEVVSELLTRMGFVAETKVVPSDNAEDGYICLINIDKEDSSFLIGQYGANLQSIQHLARLMVRKKTTDKVKFVLDINNYKQERSESLIRLAQSAAEQALSEKRAVVLKPMSNYERRLVHLELSKNSAVVTESIGESESRKVVVKPAGNF